MILHYMQVVSIWGNFNEKSNTVFCEKYETIIQYSVYKV